MLTGRYRIDSVLGDGGMGRVFAARDQLKDEEVAIKVLRSELLSSVAARGRFLSEAKVSCRLAYPNIIRVFDVGIADGRIEGLMYPSGIAAGIGTALIIEFCEAFFRARRMHIAAAMTATVLWIAVVLFAPPSGITG